MENSLSFTNNSLFYNVKQRKFDVWGFGHLIFYSFQFLTPSPEGRRQKGVSEMLLELCITELEDVAAELEEGGSQGVRGLGAGGSLAPVTQESNHPYTDDANQSGRVRIPGKMPPATFFRCRLYT